MSYSPSKHHLTTKSMATVIPGALLFLLQFELVTIVASHLKLVLVDYHFAIELEACQLIRRS